MRSILRFVFVVVPTAALAAGVVVAVSRNGQGATRVTDGDLQRDLELASATSIELAPVGQPLATVSSIEAPPTGAPARATKLRRSNAGTRALRSPRPTVKAAPEPEVAEAAEESETTEVVESTSASTEATAVAPEDGGVALPRPTAIPVSYPDPGAGVYGGGAVIRGGDVDGDHCQIHGRGGRGGTLGGRIFGGGPVVLGRPRSVSLGDRIRAAQASVGETRRGSLGDRIRASRGSARSEGGGSSRASSSLGGRIRAAQSR